MHSHAPQVQALWLRDTALHAVRGLVEGVREGSALLGQHKGCGQTAEQVRHARVAAVHDLHTGSRSGAHGSHEAPPRSACRAGRFVPGQAFVLPAA